ncbi:hypothetical protein AMECASPLE_021418 [Ameca splendens]|uniref:Uncharacterized protein n=1 Tax=Ameca splendens TaxID=208324 RepID=A0ABV0XGK8_9TELE
MARGALSRSGRLAGVDLLLIFTLLSLLWPASSLIDKKDLVEIKENIQKLQHDAERRKAGNMVDHASIAELMEDAPKLIDLLRKLIKKVVPEFLPFHEAFYVFHEDIKGALGEIHVYMNKESAKEIGKIKDYEDKLTQLDMIITNLAGREADL